MPTSPNLRKNNMFESPLFAGLFFFVLYGIAGFIEKYLLGMNNKNVD